MNEDELKSTSNESSSAVMILLLPKEITGASKLIVFPDKLFKMKLFCSHVIRNNSTLSDCTNHHKIRYKFQNTPVSPENNFRRISAVARYK